jgi:hypothetical protein
MGRIEKTVFISYRRTDESWGLAIFQDLTQHGYDVFIDYDGIASGNFETVILENIRARAHFLVLLTPTALARCGDPEDWMRREIEAALDSQRNIVPLMLAGFEFDTPVTASQLTGKLAALKKYNGLPVPKGYFSPAMERLRNKFLNVQVDAVLHPASDSAEQVAKQQRDKAETEAKRRAEEEARQRAEEERRRREAEIEQRRKEEAEAKRQEVEAQRRREVEARKAEAELKRAEVERRAEEERKRAESQTKLEPEEIEARRQAEEERKQQEVAAQQQAEAERKRREAEAKRRGEEEERQRAAEEVEALARRKADEEEKARRKAEEREVPAIPRQSTRFELGWIASFAAVIVGGIAFFTFFPLKSVTSVPSIFTEKCTAVADSLCGTTWDFHFESVKLGTFGPGSLRFLPDGRFDLDGSGGHYTMSNNSMKFDIGESHYAGTVQGAQMTGTVVNANGKWSWSATKK